MAYTPNYQLQVPAPGDPTMTNAWGTMENTGRTLVDSALGAVSSIATVGGTTILTTLAGAPDQSRNMQYIFTGVLVSPAIILWPQGLGRSFSVTNATTGLFSLTLGANNGGGAPGGTVIVLAQGETAFLYTDGTDVKSRMNSLYGDTNGGVRQVVTNPNAGNAAYAEFRASNGTYPCAITMFGTGYTTAGANRQNGMQIHATGPGGMTFLTDTSDFRWWIGGVNVFQVGPTGASLSGLSLNADTGGGASVSTTGFGITVNYNSGGISTNNGSGYSVVNNANGVSLNINDNFWTGLSDYRAKNILGKFTASGSIIDAIPVHLAEYKDKTQPVRPMFLAHEVAEGGAAFAVRGEKDAVDKSGEPVLQQLGSTDPLLPIVWAEVRALRARVAKLEG